jgi:putative NADPH-quinone reductase
MQRKVLIINGHPDPDPERFSSALAAAYLRGANAGGHEVQQIDVSVLQPHPIGSEAEFAGEASPQAQAAQAQVAWADHLVIIYPLWLGGPPALLKAFFEQVFRYGFALGGGGKDLRGLLKGRSARVIVTMGMPSLIFRAVFAAAGLRAVTRGILMICGVGPIRTTVIGGVAGSDWARRRQLRRATAQGARAV